METTNPRKRPRKTASSPPPRSSVVVIVAVPPPSRLAVLAAAAALFLAAVAAAAAGTPPELLPRSVDSIRAEGFSTDHGTDDAAIEDIVSTVRAWQQREDVDLAPAEVEHGQGGDGGVGGGSTGPALPFVTLTYAQSLDGCIAVLLENDDEEEDGPSTTGKGTESGGSEEKKKRRMTTSSNLPLSCPSSLRMTHALRTVHDAVLVGGSTFSADNPRLNVRLWPPPHAQGGENNAAGGEGEDEGGTTDNELRKQPRPVVLDTELRHLGRILEAGRGIRARGLILCCARDAAAAAQDLLFKGDSLTLVGEEAVTILPCRRDPSGVGLDLRDVLGRLRDRHGVRSVMVEGGGAVLSSFAAARGVVDCLCVTVTPNLVGRWGVHSLGAYHPSTPDASSPAEGNDKALLRLGMQGARFSCIGSDCVFLAPWPR